MGEQSLKRARREGGESSAPLDEILVYLAAEEEPEPEDSSDPEPEDSSEPEPDSELPESSSSEPDSSPSSEEEEEEEELSFLVRSGLVGFFDILKPSSCFRAEAGFSSVWSLRAVAGFSSFLAVAGFSSGFSFLAVAGFSWRAEIGFSSGFSLRDVGGFSSWRGVRMERRREMTRTRGGRRRRREIKGEEGRIGPSW